MFDTTKITVVRHAKKRSWQQKREKYTEDRIEELLRRSFETRVDVDERTPPPQLMQRMSAPMTGKFKAAQRSALMTGKLKAARIRQKRKAREKQQREKTIISASRMMARLSKLETAARDTLAAEAAAAEAEADREDYDLIEVPQLTEEERRADEAVRARIDQEAAQKKNSVLAWLEQEEASRAAHRKKLGRTVTHTCA